MNRNEKDMYLPFWVGCFGFVCLAGALVCLVLMLAGSFSFTSLICFIACLGFGLSAVLCWKNQSVRMISEGTFIYRTMFGREIQYRFSEIRDLMQNRDSMTLVMENGKIHIESCAIISDRFIEAVNAALKRT